MNVDDAIVSCDWLESAQCYSPVRCGISLLNAM